MYGGFFVFAKIVNDYSVYSMLLVLGDGCFCFMHDIFSSALRTWLFQASKDGNDWKTLKSHSVDESLNEPR